MYHTNKEKEIMKAVRILLSVLVLVFAYFLSDWAIEYGKIEMLLINILLIGIVSCLVSDKVTNVLFNLVNRD